MKKTLLYLFLLCGIGFMLSSCASITTGRHQKVPVTTQPAGATAACGQQMVVTPGELILLRGEGPYTITIKKDGYWEETVILKKTLCGATAGNLVLGGFIGIGVDAMTGAMFKLVPEEISVLLKPLSGPKPVKIEEEVIEPGEVEVEQEIVEPEEVEVGEEVVEPGETEVEERVLKPGEVEKEKGIVQPGELEEEIVKPEEVKGEVIETEGVKVEEHQQAITE